MEAAGNPRSVMVLHSSWNPPDALHSGFCMNATHTHEAPIKNNMEGTLSIAIIDIDIFDTVQHFFSIGS